MAVHVGRAETHLAEEARRNPHALVGRSLEERRHTEGLEEPGHTLAGRTGPEAGNPAGHSLAGHTDCKGLT